EETGGDADLEFAAAEGRHDPLIEGVILSPLAIAPAELAALSRKLPLVLLGERDYEGPCDHVTFDNVKASDRITEHLLQQGYERIGVIGRQNNPPHATAVKRLAGYRAALRRAGVRYERKWAPAVSGAPYHKAMGAKAAHRLFALPDRPDAIYCFADVLALGALRAAREHGLHSPDDF